MAAADLTPASAAGSEAPLECPETSRETPDGPHPDSMPLPPVPKLPRYLFLQGQISRFFAELGAALQQRGHYVHRINFNAGDHRFWPLPGAVDFRGRPEDWPAFLAERLEHWQITDLVLFGDCRPLHRAAIAQARVRGLRVQVFEEGYLRPDYITLEEGGVNGHSALPRDPAAYLRAAAELPEPPAAQPIPASFGRRALDDIHYNLSASLGAARYPHYRTHRPWNPLSEYAVGARRLPLKLATAAGTRAAVQALIGGAGAAPYYLFPLQLAADSQIRYHAPPGGLPAQIRRVIASFAAQAPAHLRLVITEHPLDYGPLDIAARVAALAQEHAVADRLRFLRGGSPPGLIAAARGLITVNSTIGITALDLGVPVLALGRAIYNLPGLCDQQGLDGYWQSPTAPERVLFEAFRKVVAARTQVNGGFFSGEGIARAVEGSLRRLEASARTPSRPAADVPPPPRQKLRTPARMP